MPDFFRECYPAMGSMSCRFRDPWSEAELGRLVEGHSSERKYDGDELVICARRRQVEFTHRHQDNPAPRDAGGIR